MSVKTETVEVRRCDFCISTTGAKQCQKCGKDACPNCGRIYDVVPKYWNPDPSLTFTVNHYSPLTSAYLCHDCCNELKTALLRLGFDSIKAAA